MLPTTSGACVCVTGEGAHDVDGDGDLDTIKDALKEIHPTLGKCVRPLIACGSHAKEIHPTLGKSVHDELADCINEWHWRATRRWGKCARWASARASSRRACTPYSSLCAHVRTSLMCTWHVGTARGHAPRYEGEFQSSFACN